MSPPVYTFLILIFFCLPVCPSVHLWPNL